MVTIGYSHYYYQRRSFTDAEWAHLCKAFQKLDEGKPRGTISGWPTPDFQPLFLARWGDPSDYEPPQVDAERIAFNGWSPDNHDLGHETFTLRREMPELRGFDTHGEYFDCCKTAFKPYDLLVTAMLIVADNDCPGALRVSSDGDQDGWEPGLNLVQRVLGGPYGYPAMFRGDPEEGADDD